MLTVQPTDKSAKNVGQNFQFQKIRDIWLKADH